MSTTRVHFTFSNPHIPRVIKALIYTGMRVGELTAPHWEEADLDRAMITVKYNLFRLDGKYRLSTLKIKSSALVTALPLQLVEILREQMVWQERRKATENRWIEQELFSQAHMASTWQNPISTCSSSRFWLSTTSRTFTSMTCATQTRRF